MTSGASLQEAVSRSALLEPGVVAAFGCTLVVAPHPDDESLACGGTIALLTAAGNPVYVLFVSDGSMSHPNSKKWSAAQRVALRESEALEALAALQVPAGHARFLRLPDARVPVPGTAGGDKAVAAISSCIKEIRPRTILLPWRRDTHPDHRASWLLLQAAILRFPAPPLMLEYPLWLWERGSAEDLPRPDEVTVYRIDVSPFLKQKQEAILAHRSQISGLIDDDPAGFQLSAEVLDHFRVSFEIFMGKI